MSDQNESRKGGKDTTTEIIEEAIREARRKIDTAKSNSEKIKVGEEINRELKEAKSRLQTVIEAIKNQPQVSKIMMLRDDDDAQNALRTLMMATGVIRIEKTQLGQPGIISSKIASAPQGLPILEEIAEQSLNISTAAAIEYFFGDFIFGDKAIVEADKITQEAIEAFRELANFDPIAAEKIKTAIKKAVEAGKISGLTVDEIEKKITLGQVESQKDKLDLTRELGGDYIFQNLLGRLEEEERKFCRALINAQKFIEYVQEVKKNISDENSSITDTQLSEMISAYLEDRIRGVLYQIYEPVLREPKSNFIEYLEREGSIYSTIEAFISSLRDRLTNIKSHLKEIDIENLGLFLIPERTTIQVYDEQSQKYLPPYEVVLPTRRQSSLDDFVEYLLYELAGERSRLRYGFNLDYIRRNPHKVDPKNGFFGTLKNYAGDIKSHQIDEIFARKDEIVTAALSIMEQQENLDFLFSSWQKDPTNLTEYFSAFTYLEKRIEEFIKRNFGAKYRNWEIQRGIFNANLLLHGLLLSSFEKYSFANPPQTGIGEPTYRGQGAQGWAFFDVNALEKRFLSPDLTCEGVDYMPTNFSFYLYRYEDFEKWQISYKSSHIKGRAAYYHLAKDEFLDVKLLIESGNLTKSGGLFELSGWRNFYAYRDWLREYIGGDEKIIYKEGEADTLLKAWQSLENIGIDILEQFADKFIFSEVNSWRKVLSDEAKIDNLRTFFGYLYDRYFDIEIGRVFLKEKGNNFIKREQFIDDVMRGFLDKELTKEEKLSLVKTRIYQALTVMMWERLPLNFITLEKVNLTQNGVTVISQLREFLNKKGISDPDGTLRQALEDLILVQTILRLKVNEDMERIYKQKGNLFGEVGNLKSEVNQGRGYVINEQVIREILQEQLGDAGKERIERVIEIYNEVKRILISPLAKASWEENDPDYKERAKYYMEPLRYFSRLYIRGDFGFSITNAEVAFKFLNLSATGPETIYRIMAYNADTAETTVSLWNSFSSKLEALRMAKGDPLESKLYQELLNLHLKVRGQTGRGVIPDNVIKTFLLRTAYYIKKNDPAIPFVEDLFHWAVNHSSSFAEKKAGGPQASSAWEGDKNHLIKLFRAFSGDAGEPIIPFHADEPKMKEVSVERYGFLGKIYKKLTGKDTIRMRDISKELSAKGLENFFGSAGIRFAYEYVLPRVIIAFILLAIALAWLAGKKDLKVGNEK